MRPSSGFNKPAIARSKVLFPAPEGPEITVIPVIECVKDPYGI